MTLKEIYERKREAYAVWKAIIDQATKEDGRALTAEEQAKCNECEQAIDQCDKEIAAENEKLRQQTRLAEIHESMNATIPLRIPQFGTDGATATGRSLSDVLSDCPSYATSYDARRGALAAVASSNTEQTRLQSRALRQYLLTGMIDPGLRERAALRVDDDATGGVLVVPERFLAQLIMDLDRNIQIRQFATVIPVPDAESLGVPTIENDMGDPTWTTELKVGSEDSTLSFGKRKLTPHPVARYIKVSKDFLRKAAIDGEGIVRSRLGYKFAYVEETAFMTGSGSGEPLGLFTASNNGISTSRDVSTDNTTDSITTDGLINCKYSLTSQWLQSANLRWIFHRDLIKFIRKLKDGNGVTIWQPGLASDRPNVILDVPYIVSEFAPSTMETGLYVGLIGDLSYYWIVDQLSMQVQRLQELYAMTNQDAFVGRLACDGMPIQENAFARVKMG